MEMRIEENETVRYNAEFPELGVTHVSYGWKQSITATLGEEILRLMREVTNSAPIIGFGTAINEQEAATYLKELNDNLAAGKCRLLTVRTSAEELIGLCTLRRNLNPNNRHIADLAKGMIAERYRGKVVLPAAFYEIALCCENDGVEVLTLDVRADTPAHRAWERFGFQTYGTLTDYARANGKSFAGHFMMQKVSDLKASASEALQTKTGKAAPAAA